jgi:hypothetical protein
LVPEKSVAVQGGLAQAELMPVRRRRLPPAPEALFVLEEEPPDTRWYSHMDGVTAPRFETPEEAVAWGLQCGARGVVVRTLGPVFYLAGDRPKDWGSDIDFRAWPPPAGERAEIDVRYAAAAALADEEERRWRAYEADRRVWLAQHAPELRDVPKHECTIGLPARGCVEFEEFDRDGARCGAIGPTGRVAFGTARDVLADVTEGLANDDWLDALVAALARDRAWTNCSRRSSLDIRYGSAEAFHVTAAANRESIERFGLDWSRMETTAGIAGSQRPELDAIFLCGTIAETKFFTDMARVPSDVWAVDVEGLWLENGPTGWLIVSEPLPPGRIRLVAREVPTLRH